MAFGTIISYILFFIVNIINITNAYTISDQHDVSIINGHKITITQAPYMAIYRETGGIWGCGASIVHTQFLVTACHCIQAYFKGEAVVGTDTITGGEIYKIEKAICHPNYNDETADYDIGVLKLNKKLTLSERVKTIKMADSSVVFKKGDMFNAIGFGKTETGRASKDLLAVDIPFIDHQECSRNLTVQVTDRMICAGGGLPYHGGCYGDSGGPLTFNDQLIAAHSWGLDCQPNTPEVFASVISTRDFIDKTIANNI